MECHLVETTAAAIECLQLGRMPVRLVRHAEALGTSDAGAKRIKVGRKPVGSRSLHRLTKTSVGGKQVVTGQFIKLIDNLMSSPGQGRVSLSWRVGTEASAVNLAKWAPTSLRRLADLEPGLKWNQLSRQSRRNRQESYSISWLLRGARPHRR